MSPDIRKPLSVRRSRCPGVLSGTGLPVLLLAHSRIQPVYLSHGAVVCWIVRNYIYLVSIVFNTIQDGLCKWTIIAPIKELGKSEDLITYVTDRKGHDLRYAIDPTKIHEELGWLPETKFADGIKKTIQWYLDHKDWWEEIISGEYQKYYEKMYANR